MLGHLFNRQYRPTYHSTVTALQGCLKYPHHRILSFQSCPDCSPWCPLMFLSFLMTFQYMMAGIHLDVQLYDKVCIFLKEVWQARSAWNIPGCLILLLLLRKKILRCFAPVEEAVETQQHWWAYEMEDLSHFVASSSSAVWLLRWLEIR